MSYSIPQRAWHEPLSLCAGVFTPEYLLLQLPFQAVQGVQQVPALTCRCTILTHLSCTGAESAHTNFMQRVQEQKISTKSRVILHLSGTIEGEFVD